MGDLLFEKLGILTFWIGIFGVFDAIVDKKAKANLAEFVFGFHDKSVKDFENNVISSLLSVFVKNDKLKWKRIFLLSLAYSFLSVGGLGVFAYQSVESGDNPSLWVVGLFGLIFLLVVAIISFPLDIYSIYVTKRLFWNKNNSIFGNIIKIVFDVALSLMPILIGVASMFFSDGFSFIYMAALFQFPSVLSITIIQIITLIFGIIARSTIRLTKLNQYTVLYTNLHESPFTFLGILSGTSAVIFSSIWF
ncbi:hypothetical protein [uncultured Sulfitobacter sp.]|uniref:hypothetical protein n=1 Tax=uncultured Sulfitobacter sp. TaxID=191468 RepID=UPI00262BD8FB|nr:hypothetical protein [uncultured Sulfitobacter sp.]